MADLTRLEAAAKRLAAAEAETEAALRERDEAIVEALDNGARIIEVQFATGISGARVSQIRSKHLRERS